MVWEKYKRPAVGTMAAVILACLCLCSFRVQAAGRLQETGDPVVIVIDPGHGGENQGTIENGHEEKTMTMITAQAMYDELSLYDGVEVYLTRTGDTDMAIKDRAEFAADKEADFLFSLHYNASENHELFGAEVWTSAFAPYNGYGYQFGFEFLTDMREKGLFVRGVKTRLGDKGLDYYGIIRYSVELGIPAVIIEHCHVDEAHDEDYCATEEQLKEFGRADALAAAKYFGLKSSALQVDYSGYELADSDDLKAVPITLKDNTPPDICRIEEISSDYENNLLTLSVSAADYDSPLLYYDYSLDGGVTFSSRFAWPDSDTLTGTYTDSFSLNLTIPDGVKPSVVVRAYNMFDLFTESNCYTSLHVFASAALAGTDASDIQSSQEMSSLSGTDTAEEDESEAVLSQSAKAQKEVSLLTFLEICLGVVVILFVILLISQIIALQQKKRRMRQRRKESGARRNQPR